eukprot:2343280-Alexandrium_andersonii.AAC.1
MTAMGAPVNFQGADALRSRCPLTWPTSFTRAAVESAHSCLSGPTSARCVYDFAHLYIYTIEIPQRGGSLNAASSLWW